MASLGYDSRNLVLTRNVEDGLQAIGDQKVVRATLAFTNDVAVGADTLSNYVAANGLILKDTNNDHLGKVGIRTVERIKCGLLVGLVSSARVAFVVHPEYDAANSRWELHVFKGPGSTAGPLIECGTTDLQGFDSEVASMEIEIYGR